MKKISKKNYAELQFFDVLESMKPVVEQLAVGDSRNLADQLIAKSLQPHILQFTPNDAVHRFKNYAMYKTWLEHGHTMHWLLGPNNDLAGVIWYREKTFPITSLTLKISPIETFAIRLYEGYVGHHLAMPFMKLSLRTFIETKLKNKQPVKDMWLSTTPENIPAIASYTKLGYEEVYRDDRQVIMVMSSEDIVKLIKSID